jgi:thiol-disulfide isomerase/thioredoxin
MARLGPAVMISAVLVLAGCGGGEDTGSAPASTEPTTTSSSPPADDAAGGASATSEPAAPEPAEPPAPVVPEQLRFTAKTLDGKDFSGESLAGKPALLWFWAPWCPNCQAEAPTIAEAAKNAGNVAFVGVAAQDEVPAMQKFVDKYDLGSFPHLADTDATVWQRFGVTYQPAYAFVSSDGTVEIETANLDDDELRTRIGALR